MKKQVFINITAGTIVIILMIVVLQLVSASNLGFGVIATPTTETQESNDEIITNDIRGDVVINGNAESGSDADDIGGLSSSLVDVIKEIISPIISDSPIFNQQEPEVQPNDIIIGDDGMTYPSFHYECIDNKCKVTLGGGADSCFIGEICSTNDDDKHLECVITEENSHICMLVNGEESDSCRESTNCSTDDDGLRTKCIAKRGERGSSCSFIKGEGADECNFMRAQSCDERYHNRHTECVDGKCQWVGDWPTGDPTNMCNTNPEDDDCAQQAQQDDNGQNEEPQSTSWGQRVVTFLNQIWAGFISLFKK